MGRKSYRLLSINDVMSWRTRLFSREGNEDTYTVNVDEGIDGLCSKLSWMINEGMTFQNAVFTTHGNRGVLYFAGCRVADSEQGWSFLEAAARTLLATSGGVAIGFTSLGFGSPFSGHVRHLWGDTRQVMFIPGRDGANLLFFENGNRVDDGVNRPS